MWCMFLLRLINIAYKYLTMLQSPPGTGKHELKKKRRAHRQPVRHEKIAQEEKAFLQTGRERLQKLSSYKGKSVPTDRLEIIE